MRKITHLLAALAFLSLTPTDLADPPPLPPYECSGQLTFACLVTGGTGVFCDNVLIDVVHISGICGD